MPTVYGYLRLTLADGRDPGRLERHRAAVVEGQAARVAQGFALGEIVTDDPAELRAPMMQRPGGRRLAQLAQAGDVILIPTTVRLARSVNELHDTFRRWHAAGVAGVVLDLGLDFAQAEARAALALMQAGADLNRGLAPTTGNAEKTDDEARTVNRWGLAVSPKTRVGVVVPAELDLAARCAAWFLGGNSYERIALHLTRIYEPLPKRWKKRNRVRFAPSPFWRKEQVRNMVESYTVVADLHARGVVGTPRGYTMPTVTPTPDMTQEQP